MFTSARVRIGKYVRLGTRKCPTKDDQRVERHPCINNITISACLCLSSLAMHLNSPGHTVMTY